MLHACVRTFNVTGIVEIFLGTAIEAGKHCSGKRQQEHQSIEFASDKEGISLARCCQALFFSLLPRSIAKLGKGLESRGAHQPRTGRLDPSHQLLFSNKNFNCFRENWWRNGNRREQLAFRAPHPSIFFPVFRDSSNCLSDLSLRRQLQPCYIV